MKIQSNKQQQLELEQAQAWRESKPSQPSSKRPKWDTTDNILFNGFVFFVVWFFVSLFLGMGYVVVQATWLLYTIAVGFGGTLAGFGIAAGVNFLAFAIPYKRGGWDSYDEDLEVWKLAGIEDCGAIAASNEMVDRLLRSELENRYRSQYVPPADLKAAQATLRPRLPLNGWDEYDNLEFELDNARPAPGSPLASFPRRKARRDCRAFAKAKSRRTKAEKRSLFEAQYQLRSRLGLNSAGWLQSSPARKVDEDALRALITPIATANGLHVSACELATTGMTDGPGGSWNHYTLFVRFV